MGWSDTTFFTPVYIITLEILKERKIPVSFSRRFLKLALKSPRSSTEIHFWDKKAHINSKFCIHWEKFPTTNIMFLLTRHIID